MNVVSRTLFQNRVLRQQLRELSIENAKLRTQSPGTATQASAMTGTHGPPNVRDCGPGSPVMNAQSPRHLTDNCFRGGPHEASRTQSLSNILPAPGPQQSSAPAGKGLMPADDFGPQAVRTAGGYTIVPETKDAAWSIYAPGQKPGDTPNTRVWGDPHVTEADGTRWDFTKNSSFRLPDGTNIAVTTTAQEGQSVSKALDITNGADRVQISDIDKNQPKRSVITPDGYTARANLAANDTFHLGGDAQGKVQWFKQNPQGKLEGEVVSAKLVNNQYEQTVDPSSQYVVDPSLRPAVGTAAWASLIRSQTIDAVRGEYGTGSPAANLVAKSADQSHAFEAAQPAGQLTAAAAEQRMATATAPATAQQNQGLEQLEAMLQQVMKLFDLFRLNAPARNMPGYSY